MGRYIKLEHFEHCINIILDTLQASEEIKSDIKKALFDAIPSVELNEQVVSGYIQEDVEVPPYETYHI